MKIHSVMTSVATTLLLATASLAHAGETTKHKKHARTTQAQFTQDRYAEMVITRDQQPLRAQPQANSAWVGGEIGNNAPHQERNPSAHPELFRINP